jgi:hypothetical protein
MSMAVSVAECPDTVREYGSVCRWMSRHRPSVWQCLSLDVQTDAGCQFDKTAVLRDKIKRTPVVVTDLGGPNSLLVIYIALTSY